MSKLTSSLLTSLWLALVFGHFLFLVKGRDLPKWLFALVAILDVILCPVDFALGIISLSQLGAALIAVIFFPLLFTMIWAITIMLGFVGLLMLTEPQSEKEVYGQSNSWIRTIGQIFTTRR